MLVKDIFPSRLRAIKSFYIGLGIATSLLCVNYEKRENVLPAWRYQIT